MSAPIVLPLSLGPMQNFVYLLACPETRQAAVVDPAFSAAAIEAALVAHELRLTHILCTHSHWDHVNRVDELLRRHDVPVSLLAEEIDHSGFSCENLRRAHGGDALLLGRLPLRLLHTPGHTPGSMTVQLPGAILTGDTLFVSGCGRCDFVGGDPVVMFETLQGLTRRLPGDTRLYPGHDYGRTPESTLSAELLGNPYLQHATVADFVAHRMAGKVPNTRPSGRPDWPAEG